MVNEEYQLMQLVCCELAFACWELNLFCGMRFELVFYIDHLHYQIKTFLSEDELENVLNGQSRLSWWRFAGVDEESSPLPQN